MYLGIILDFGPSRSVTKNQGFFLGGFGNMSQKAQVQIGNGDIYFCELKLLLPSDNLC